MKALLKKSLAVLMAALMAFSLPAVAFAAEEDMTLETSSKCYAGVTYDVVATVNNLTSDQVIGDSNTQSAFTWSTDNGSTISTTNSYKITELANGTFTVSETARITFPDKVGVTNITAVYGKINSKTISVTTLQPITSISVSPVSNSEENYYYETSGDTTLDTLYLNSYNGNNRDLCATLNYSVLPVINDDGVTAGVNNPKYTSVLLGEDTIVVKFTNADAPEEDTLTVSATSGYKFSKKIKLVECTPLTGYKLRVNSTDVATAEAGGTNAVSGSISNAIVGDSITFTPVSKSPSSANDSIKYILYNPDGTVAPSSYYSVDSKGNCTINPANPGTYRLASYAVSKGEHLPRDLGTSVSVTYSEANPITSLSLCNLNNGILDLSSKLELVTLYTATKNTYDLSQNLSALPVGHSHGVVYTSSNTAVVTVDAKGVITAKASGTATIYVSSEKNSNIVTSCDVKVINELTAITTITAETTTLPQGHSVQLVAVTNPINSDEKIRWSSNCPEALSIDINGYATANPNYDLEGATEKYVQVTATSESGKTSSNYITIIPAISATKVVPVIDSDTVVKNDDGTYSVFNTRTFNLTARGVNDAGEESNDIYEWYVSLNNGPSVDIPTAVANKYFTCKYESAIDTYVITAEKAGIFDFYCYALKRGEAPSNNCVFGHLTLNVIERATGITLIECPKTLPTQSNVEFSISMSPFTALIDDPVVFTSDNESVARVEKIANDKAVIITGDTQGRAVITYFSESQSVKKTMTITVTNNISFAQVSGVDSEYGYTGSAIAPVPVVVYNGITLIEGTHYSRSYSNNTNAGIATLTITGKGDFASSVKVINYTILPKSLEGSDITAVSAEKYVTITDTNIAPIAKLTVKDQSRSKTLALNTDYKVEALNNTVSGDATAIITGCGNYTGTISTTFKVRDSIAKAKVSSIANQKYTGSSLKPSFTVTYNGKTLTPNVHFTYSYSNNTSIGKAVINITGKEPYFTGTLKGYFNIIPKNVYGFKGKSRTASSVTLQWTADDKVDGYQIYDVNAKKIVKTVSGGKTVNATISSLSSQKVYQYKIRSYKSVNNVKYYSDYSGTYATYTLPKTPTLKLTTTSRTVSSSWTKISGVNGYQYQISTKSNFSGAGTTTVSWKTTSKKFTKLTKGRTYYVRVRAYKKLTINSKTVTVYSAWSTKNIKCK